MGSNLYSILKKRLLENGWKMVGVNQMPVKPHLVALRSLDIFPRKKISEIGGSPTAIFVLIYIKASFASVFLLEGISN